MGVGVFSKVVVTFNQVGGSFNLVKYHQRGCLNNPIFSNLGLYAACGACFVSLQIVAHSSESSLLSQCLFRPSWRKISENYFCIPIFRLVLQNFAFLGCFPYILFRCYLFAILSSDWFVIAVCGSISIRELVKWLVCFVNWYRVADSNDKSS